MLCQETMLWFQLIVLVRVGIDWELVWAGVNRLARLLLQVWMWLGLVETILTILVIILLTIFTIFWFLWSGDRSLSL